jgi:hypothetical protein
MSKILFLDIDGVLNLATIYGYNKSGVFSRACCHNLRFLLNKVPDLKIVVSSSWHVLGLSEDKRILQANGIDSSRIVDIVGDDNTGEGKGDKKYHIGKWLERNLEVTEFVIIDDDSVSPDRFYNKLIKPNSFVGLTIKDVEKAIEILDSK